MGTGIVSVALWLAGHRSLSDVLLAVAVVLWAGLAVVVLARRAVSHEPAALTAVAGTGVLGTRLVLGGHTAWAGAALAVAAVLLAVLLPGVLRRLPRRTTGGALLLTVACQSVAGLAAGLGDGPALRIPAAVLFVAGVLLYADVLRRFDVGQLRTGAGDHWILGGALAISALAAAKLEVEPAAVVLWAIAIAWVPVLLAEEVRHPRPRYDARRWATVFPVGMDAVATLTVGRLLRSDGLLTAGRVWTWVALALWAVVFAGMARAVSRAR